MDYLDSLESKTIYIIREAYAQFRKLGLLWSIGKDSTTLLWMARKAFFGKIPFPIIHIDTGYKFTEIYKFRQMYAKEWMLDVIISKNFRQLEKGLCPKNNKFRCCNALKTEALKQTLLKHGLKALLLGIRRDEHGVRAKERYFSPRNQNFKWDYLHQPIELWDLFSSSIKEKEHFRIHPLLHWREIDIWRYIKREKIPVVGLYFSRFGKRYRSIGCEPCCKAVRSKADTINKIIKELSTTKISERYGRAQDKEDPNTMQKLRSLGYM
ncbi:MAG: sulfate adenylyltransferase subunit CysD [Elusimicrobia bacterium]|nr:sulfate adenylyltransferase subunit CysD [Candidatus Liberimonas magnetica]